MRLPSKSTIQATAIASFKKMLDMAGQTLQFISSSVPDQNPVWNPDKHQYEIPSVDPEDLVKGTTQGVLQPNTSGKPAVTQDDAGGALEVPVANVAFVPFAATPARGWIVRDTAGNTYEQVTPPIDAANMGVYWRLNLGEARVPHEEEAQEESS